jgi:hypothetical protein
LFILNDTNFQIFSLYQVKAVISIKKRNLNL